MAVRPILALIRWTSVLRSKASNSWRQFQIHSPKLSRLIANWGWAGLILAAFTVESTREYWLALLLFIAAAASLVFSLIYWRGIDESRGFTITVRIFGHIFAVVILVTSLIWIYGEKDNQAWSRLPEYYVRLIPPIPPPPPALSPFRRHYLVPQPPPGGWVSWWGVIPPDRLRVIANLDPILPVGRHFNVILVCRVADYSIDPMLDTNIEKSAIFAVSPSPMIMEMQMSQQLMNRAYPNKTVNIYLVMVPGLGKVESISKLRDVEAMDGSIVAVDGIALNLVKRRVLTEQAAPKPPM